MDTDILQWLAIIFLIVWNLGMSLWIGETTELLKTWWRDFLRDMVADEYRDRLEQVRGWTRH